MFRLSCFHTPALSGKQRKTVQLSSEPLQNTAKDFLQTQVPNSHTSPLVSDLSNTMVEGGSVENFADHATDSCAVEFDEETDGKYSIDRDILVHSSVGIKKSCSLGSFLDRNGRGSDIAFEDEVKQSYSDESHDKCSSPVPNAGKDSGISLPTHFQEALASTVFQENFDVVNHGSFYTAGDAQELENLGHVDRDDGLSCEDKSSGNTPQTPTSIVKSFSLPYIGSPGRSFGLPFPHSRSAEDLHALDSRQKVTLNPEAESNFFQHHEDRNLDCNEHDGDNIENPIDYRCGRGTSVGSAKDFVVPVGDEAGMNNRRASDLSSKDFTKKRIEEWVLDLQQCSHLEASNDLSAPEIIEVEKYGNSLDIYYARKEEGKVNSPGMEAARKYISSLAASATTAQLNNLGLVEIPFLSPFSSLRALNLSGNAIVRITSGALPRGLHVLNLSKNNIATIEGLRDLIRLRVLDLSYNRILRIGHGLAYCSALKELYLAGNKISEVEGLHRLLKLNVLDLRFNKISTTKCLGQLAANYLSLQVISLEGNPAQKNVGDEQLKKYLQGLLPHLAYFNRKPVKVGSLMKDTAERSARLGIGAHQNDRSLKSDVKNIRKGGATSSVHARRSQPIVSSTKPSSSKHLRLLPSTSGKPVTEQSNLHKPTNKLLSLKSDLSVRKSRSVGNLGEL